MAQDGIQRASKRPQDRPKTAPIGYGSSQRDPQEAQRTNERSCRRREAGVPARGAGALVARMPSKKATRCVIAPNSSETRNICTRSRAVISMRAAENPAHSPARQSHSMPRVSTSSSRRVADHTGAWARRVEGREPFWRVDVHRVTAGSAPLLAARVAQDRHHQAYQVPHCRED